jgi:hypothetical protein
MFNRPIINEYGSYFKKNEKTVYLLGVYDKNFIELPIYDPTVEQYKVFPSENINFAIKINKAGPGTLLSNRNTIIFPTSIYIPSHLFSKLKTAYLEGNPYYTIENLVTVEIDIAKFLFGVIDKYTRINTDVITTDFTVSPTGEGVVAITDVKKESRLNKAGVRDIEYQFYINNEELTLDDNDIISQIKFLFEDTNIRVGGSWHTVNYLNADGSVIIENLPTGTDIVPPLTQRINSMEDYLRDVKRK